MTTFFLRKKFWRALVGGIAVVFTLLCFCYSLFLSQIKVVPIYASFYFLATEEMHVEAGAELIKLEGGAGYVLCLEGKEYAVMSVYLKESEGEGVHTSITAIGKRVRLLPVHIQYLYFKGRDKKRAQVYLSALKLLKGYISLTEECTAHLVGGATQERIKRILDALREQMLYVAKQYEKEYLSFSRLCIQVAEEFTYVGNEIIYASDLRYISCQMVDGYLGLCRQFAL